eukprot:1352-Lingulodinium_polyedra.AAC.1
MTIDRHIVTKKWKPWPNNMVLVLYYVDKKPRFMLRDAEWVIEEVGQMRPGEGIGGEDKPPRHVWAYMGDHPDCPTAKVWHDMGRDLATES